LTHSILVILVLFLKFFNPFLEKSTGIDIGVCMIAPWDGWMGGTVIDVTIL